MGVPSCTHCQASAKLVGGDAIYPHRKDLYKKSFYLYNCGAYVGCHPNTDKPLGTPANAALRKLRGHCHSLFDPLWRDGDMKRSQAYAWLAQELSIDIKRCHIGMFDESLCNRAIEVLCRDIL